MTTATPPRESDRWATPPEVFLPLHAEFAFTLDAAAEPATAKAPKFYTPEDDGLTQSWAGETVWLNPPYSDVTPWLRKAVEAAQAGATVVCLVRHDPSTAWWRELVDGKAEVRPSAGRVRFVRPDGSRQGAYNFPTCVLVYRGQPQANATDTTALDLFRHIYGDLTGRIGVFSGTRETPHAKQLAGVEEQTYAYPAAASWAAHWLAEASRAGREAYHCAHLLTDTKRSKRNAAKVLSLWADIDDGNVPSTFPPTALIASSPGRHQGYWKLDRAIPPEQAEALNKRIAHAIGADKSGWDLTQLLRVPGTPNRKYEGAPLVRVVYIRDDHSYNPDELAAMLPPLPTEQTGRARPEAGDGETPAWAGQAPPVRLTGYAAEVYNGLHPVMKEGGVIDRSASLWAIAGELLKANASVEATAAALAERDAALGYDCYTGRPDAAHRYTETARKKWAEIEHGDDAPAVAVIGPDEPAPAASVSADQLAALERENARLRSRARRMVHRARKAQRGWAEARRRCDYATALLAKIHAAHAYPHATAQDRINTVQLACDLERQYTAGMTLPGNRYKVTFSEPPPETPEEERRAGYSLAKRAGCSAKSVSRTTDKLVEMGALDKYVGAPELRRGGFARDVWLIRPAASGHPGLDLLDAFTSYEPPAPVQEEQPKSEPVRCKTHPEAKVIVTYVCSVDGEVLKEREYTPPPPAPVIGQIVHLHQNGSVIGHSVLSHAAPVGEQPGGDWEQGAGRQTFRWTSDAAAGGDA